jgi:predicted TIM-barrel fold metal-dependent hydrolase
MRFNCHTHIFNLKSVFTTKTLQIFLNRIGRENWPPFVIEVVDHLAKQAIKGVPLDEDEIIRAFAEKLGDSKKFKSFLSGLTTKIPGDVQLLVEGDPALVGTNALRDRLRRLGDLITTNNDAENKTLSDLIATLIIAFKPSIATVADKLMELSGPDTTVVALTLDITTGGGADEALFKRQIEDTANAALGYPGRILPFVSVNEQRDSHFAHMDFALTQRGFVGVKLYPSLGTDVRSDKMARVFDYCAGNDIPIVLHCNNGGFYASRAEIELSNPAHWKRVLEARPNLRVCFGHFGGDENLIVKKIPSGSWTDTILKLMADYDHVYADIAYHERPMAGGTAQSNYFGHLANLLASGEKTAGRILFGSDFFLVRQRVREDNLWEYFQNNFSAAHFKRITETNPAEFLGLPDADGAGARLNIIRHLRWLADHRSEVNRTPADWAVNAIRASIDGAVKFSIQALGPLWTTNNTAHYYTWFYLQQKQMYPTEAALKFEDAGTVTARQLQYWNKEHEAPEIFSAKVAGVARGLHNYLRKYATYEEGVDQESAIEAFESSFKDGERQAYQIAGVASDLFRFPNEG